MKLCIKNKKEFISKIIYPMDNYYEPLHSECVFKVNYDFWFSIAIFFPSNMFLWVNSKTTSVRPPCTSPDLIDFPSDVMMVMRYVFAYKNIFTAHATSIISIIFRKRNPIKNKTLASSLATLSYFINERTDFVSIEVLFCLSINLHRTSFLLYILANY